MATPLLGMLHPANCQNENSGTPGAGTGSGSASATPPVPAGIASLISGWYCVQYPVIEAGFTQINFQVGRLRQRALNQGFRKRIFDEFLERAAQRSGTVIPVGARVFSRMYFEASVSRRMVICFGSRFLLMVPTSNSTILSRSGSVRRSEQDYVIKPIEEFPD